MLLLEYTIYKIKWEENLKDNAEITATGSESVWFLHIRWMIYNLLDDMQRLIVLHHRFYQKWAFSITFEFVVSVNKEISSLIYNIDIHILHLFYL